MGVQESVLNSSYGKCAVGVKLFCVKSFVLAVAIGTGESFDDRGKAV